MWWLRVAHLKTAVFHFRKLGIKLNKEQSLWAQTFEQMSIWILNGDVWNRLECVAKGYFSCCPHRNQSDETRAAASSLQSSLSVFFTVKRPSVSLWPSTGTSGCSLPAVSLRRVTTLIRLHASLPHNGPKMLIRSFLRTSIMSFPTEEASLINPSFHQINCYYAPYHLQLQQYNSTRFSCKLCPLRGVLVVAAQPEGSFFEPRPCSPMFTHNDVMHLSFFTFVQSLVIACNHYLILFLFKFGLEWVLFVFCFGSRNVIICTWWRKNNLESWWEAALWTTHQCIAGPHTLQSFE